MDGSLEIKVKRIHRFSDGKSLKAFADITVNDVLLVKGLRVMDGQRGLFVSMPREQAKDKKWYDSVRCLTREIRQEIVARVLEAYKAETR